MFSRAVLAAAALCAMALPAFNQTVTCSSEDGHRHYCPADTRGGVEMVRQRSGSACQQGYSWGFDDRGVWVDHGCRADFAVQTGAGAGGRTVYCASEDGGRHYCTAETRAGVQLAHQRSGSPCEQGRSWGFDDRGIWVDHGCRADFALETGPQGYGPNSFPGNGGGTVYCASDDGGRRHCQIDTRAGVRLVQQRSGSPCEQGRSWGFDERGVWVDHGCRAEFAAGGSSGNFSSSAPPCNQAVGSERASRLVDECTRVSPATHPPCNAQNSCVMIIDEIKRGCAQLGRNAPQFCDEYR